MEETMMSSGAVYVQTNEPENAVIAYRRGDDGALTRLGAFADRRRRRREAAPDVAGLGRALERRAPPARLERRERRRERLRDPRGRARADRADADRRRPEERRRARGHGVRPQHRQAGRNRVPARGHRSRADRRQALSAENADPAQVGLTPTVACWSSPSAAPIRSFVQGDGRGGSRRDAGRPVLGPHSVRVRVHAR